MTKHDIALSARIYDAAIDPSVWEGVLDNLCREIGAKGAVLLVLETLGNYRYSISMSSSLYSEEVQRRYEREFSRHEQRHFSNVAVSRPGEIVLDEDYVCDPVAFRMRPDVEFLEKTSSVFERFAMRLNSDRAWFDCLAMQFDRTRSNIRPEEELRLRTFVHHLARAIDLSRSFAELKRRYNAVLGALDRFLIAVALVLPSTRIILCNRTAQRLLELDDGLGISRNGHILARDPRTHARLHEAIGRACDLSAGASQGGSTRLFVAKRSGREQLLVDVAPIRDVNQEVERHFHGAFLTVVDPDQRLPLSLDGLSQLYSLTASETAVARLLIDGSTNREIAGQRGVSQETVKAQIAAVLSKTGARNRTELISRLLSVTLPVE